MNLVEAFLDQLATSSFCDISFCPALCVNMNCLYVSSEAWVNTADTVIELLAVLHQHTELSAEFFLMCLEVCHTMCTLSTGFHLYSVNDKPPWCIFMSLPPILWAVGGIMFSAGLSVHVQRCQPSRFWRDFPAFTSQSRLPGWDIHILAFHNLRRHAIIIVYYALMAAHTSDQIATTNTPNGHKRNAPIYYKSKQPSM